MQNITNNTAKSKLLRTFVPLGGLNQGQRFTVEGQVARTICELVDTGDKGITALEMSKTWAFRLAAYVHILRHTYSIEIQTIMEPHPGGRHARYILKTPVQILWGNS